MKLLAITLVTIVSWPVADGAEARPDYTAHAILRTPGGEVKQIIDGRLWRCSQASCRGSSASAPRSQPPAQECARVAARLGELSRYRTGKREFSAAELAECNRRGMEQR